MWSIMRDTMTLIDQARERKDIPEYKRLYKELTGKDIEITQYHLVKTG